MSNEKDALSALIQIPKALIESVPVVGPLIGYVCEDYANRQLSKLEEFRVGEAAKYCIGKIESKIQNGFTPRDDDRFFASNENYRSSAEEIFEGVLTKCKLEHEQKKSNYISNLFVNVAFEKVSVAQANFLLKLVGTMTYRQLCLIKLFYQNKNNVLGLKTTETVMFFSENISILQEIFELTQLGLVQKLMAEADKTNATWRDAQLLLQNSFNAMFGWDEVIPGCMELTALGETAYKLLSLEEMSVLEIENLIKELK
ncbi:hypothetical protein MNQ98_06165 [Paenibacillus sp. N3/727]|uniref:hypothetical protein n=1 Tax=Paenibacillus sp. N3/727 TaxID=2925845 RepID=UPI001F538934|nr:hypothetical protein [Paenibacillus sp. N3/727]UNK19614.1 hypothetical protein MNQ98_06165 [Paenibacillus sp. N3/727]